MKSFLAAGFKRWTGTAGLLVTGLFLSGCGHLYYADPNPGNPYTFPGETPAQKASASPSMSPRLGTSSAFTPEVAPVATVGRPPVVPINTPAPAPAPADSIGGGSSILRVGDKVTVSFTDTPLPIVDQIQRVGEDGKIILPFNVSVTAVGKTPSQLADDIRKEYVPRYYVRLTATVKTDERFYFVGGEVRIPARQPYLGDMTVLRSIDTAGGFTDFANRKKIELRRANGQRHIINYEKARENSKLDLPVYANDQVTVPKRRF
jgi:protein involved in polysaccharide export with SLBB domain